MSERWRSSARKLERAAEHFRVLHDELRGYIRDGNPFDYRAEIDTGNERFRITITGGNPAPDTASLIVGDFVQNLRASLDHLIYAAVEANGNTPTHRTSFPILTEAPQDSGRARNQWKNQLDGIADAARPLIEQVQPYKLGDQSHLTTLASLQALSNEDKHRVVLQTLKAVPNPDEAAPDLEFEVEDLEEIESYELHAMKPLASGDTVMEAAVKVTGPNPNVRVKGRLPVELAFGEARIPTSQLATIFDRVDVIVGHLANELLGANLSPQPLGARLGHEVFEGPHDD